MISLIFIGIVFESRWAISVAKIMIFVFLITSVPKKLAPKSCEMN